MYEIHTHIPALNFPFAFLFFHFNDIGDIYLFTSESTQERNKRSTGGKI